MPTNQILHKTEKIMFALSFCILILKIICFKFPDNSDKWNLKAPSGVGISVLKTVTSSIIIITNEGKCFFSLPYTKMCSFLNTTRPLADREQQFHLFHHQILSANGYLSMGMIERKLLSFMVFVTTNYQSYLQNQQCENNYSH